jgi:hypothetical protein
MKRTNVWVVVAFSVMTACGGGGGGSDSSTPTPPAPPPPPPAPTPTATLDVSNSTVHTDGRLEITWTSSNVTDCTAEGAWLGSVPTAGSQKFVMTTLGTFSFGLRCVGANGTANATKTVTVAHDINKQVMIPDSIAIRPADFLSSYPAVFQATPQLRAANNPYCAISADEVVVPASFVGTYPLPTPAGKLPSGILRGAGFKDYYPINPSSGNDCAFGTDLARASYLVALERASRLGVDHIWVYNYGVWKDLMQEVWEVEASDIQIPDDELAWLVSEASKRNIKVFLEWQLLNFDKLGRTFSPDPDEAMLRRMIESHKRIILQRAAHAEQIGIAGMTADWTAFWVNFSTPALQDQFSDGMLDVLKAVRPIFSGKVIYGFLGVVDPEHLPYFDLLRLELYATVTNAEMSTLTVNLLRQRYLDYIDDLVAWGRPTQKPVLWHWLVQSRREWFTQGWVEDGFCVNSCIQRTYTTDYSVQALGVEALFQALAAQTRFQTAAVAVSSAYWLSDAAMPAPNTDRAAFPNISQSIRNKPAEAIVRHWFSR